LEAALALGLVAALGFSSVTALDAGFDAGLVFGAAAGFDVEALELKKSLGSVGLFK
jgi:hypothetical protein